MPDKETVLVLTSNLFFMPRIEAAAEAGGLDTVSASTSAALMEAEGRNTVPLVLVDLEIEEPVWTEALESLKAAKIFAADGRSSADGGGLKYLPCSSREVAVTHNFSHVGRSSHVHNHITWIGIRTDRHINSSCLVFFPAVECSGATNYIDGAMGNTDSGIAH